MVPDRCGSVPAWMMNSSITRAQWDFIPCKPLIPQQVPPDLRRYGSVLEVTGPPQPLLAAAVKEGIFLTMHVLTEIQGVLHFEVPDAGQGSGTKGGVVKEDYCRGLVEKLWGSESEEEKTRMVAALMGQALSSKKVRRARGVIQAVKELGIEGERDFKEIHRVALNQEAVERDLDLQKDRAPRKPTEERSEIQTFTPAELKSFVPPEHGALLSRNPLLKRYQAHYPRTLTHRCFSLLPVSFRQPPLLHHLS